ncbi:MAG: EamA family transporter [Clostridia bacterium]|nr:EamA family transporter [Clostridia bacterium]
MKKSALLCVLAAGILWGCMGFFVRTLQNEYGFGSLQIVCLRLVFAALAFVILGVIRRTPAIRLRHALLLFCTGFCGIMLLSVTYFLSMTYSSLSVAAILMYTAPAFVLIASVILFKEKLTGTKILSLILAFAGCVFVSGIFGGDAKITAMGVVMGILSGITYGSYSIFGTYALRKYDTYTVTTWAFIFAALASLAVGNVPDIVIKIASSENNALRIIILSVGMGIFTAFMPFLLYTIGLSRTEPSKAIIVASVEPLVATVLGFAVFGETPTVFSAVGIVLILASVVLTTVKKA